MVPGTGTPDYVASLSRICSICRPAGGIRLPAAVLSISVVLAGCTSQPRAPDTSAGAGHPTSEAASDIALPPLIGETARGRDNAGRAPRGIEPPESRDPTVIGVPGGRHAQPPGSGSDHETASSGDVWDRIRNGMNLQFPQRKRIEDAIEWYLGHSEYLHRLTERARPYLAYIVQEVEKRGLPMEFALLPAVESAFHERAYSRAGASGLWQFMPSTGRRYGLKQNWWYDGRRDIVESTRAALEYLTVLLKEFDDDPLLAVAAYNWGEGNVRRAISRNRAQGKPGDVWSLRLPRETRLHVRRFAAIAVIVGQPERYGVTLASIPDHVHFRSIPLDRQVSLAFAADLAGVGFRELRRLNPGFRRSTTAPDGPHRLLVPAVAAERLPSLAQIPPERRKQWTRHAVVRGDTLGAIAAHYGTSVRALKDANGLASDRILAGTHLMIPERAGPARRAVARSEPRMPAPAAENFATTASLHRVRSGDSLWLIANRHGVDMEQLATWNGLSTRSVLQPDQVLRLSPVPHASSQDTLKRIRYRVKRGDSLWEISRQFGVSIASLRRWNRLPKNEPLMPGRELFVHLTDTPTI